MNSSFELRNTDPQSGARAGILHTGHGDIPTPVFMPVGTQATVKATGQRTLHELGARIILGNTYHLFLRPGNEVISHFGGLHKFMNWSGSLLTDSGGYQIFSLKDRRSLSEEGAEFQSHIDGSRHFFSPENVVETQRILGPDIMMVLDECTPYPASRSEAEDSMKLSLLWAKRAKDTFEATKEHYAHKQLHFGIGQGGMYADLRRKYIDEIASIGFDGYAIGGLSVGEPAELMYEMTGVCTAVMPKDKPRYLMGVGTPENILECIALGIDMFDCVLPTRNARNGQLFTSRGKINLRNSKYRLCEEVIDNKIESYASRNFSLGYLRHLFIANEILGIQLATMHNIAFYLNLAETAREKIIEGNFAKWKKEFLDYYNNSGL